MPRVDDRESEEGGRGLLSSLLNGMKTASMISKLPPVKKLLTEVTGVMYVSLSSGQENSTRINLPLVLKAFIFTNKF